MERIPHHTNLWLLSTIVALATIVFALDVSLPLGVAVGALYAVPVLASLWIPRWRYTLVAAGLGSVLTILDTFISPFASLAWIVVLNRGFALFVIWATATLVLLHKRQTARIKTLQGLLPICAACKKIRDDRGYWNNLEMYISHHSAATFTHGICPQCTELALQQIEHVATSHEE